MNKIKLSNCDEHALVDDDDFEWALKYTWRKQGNYVCRDKRIGPRKKNKKILLYLHKEIYKRHNTLTKKCVDHIDGDTLNNKKVNLREATRAENNRNRRNYKKTSSKYKGVSYNNQLKKYTAYICYNKKTKHLGCFEDEVLAAKTYDKEAKKLFKEFAHINFPER